MTHLPTGSPSSSGLIPSETQCKQDLNTANGTVGRVLARRAVSIISAAVLLLFSGFCNSAMAQTLAPGWNQQSPATAPSARYLHGLTYDAGQSQVVLFGGIGAGGSPLSDTWLWNGTAWSKATPTNNPTARDAFGMTYDATQGNTVLFGGRLNANTWTNDTWLWNGSNWTQAIAAGNPSSPAVRSNMTMVYDATHGNDVMFGGLVSGTPGNDTWIWNGTTWTQASVSASPSARYSYSMVYDAAHGQVILFGGQNASGNNLSDTWVWNGTTWTQLSPGNNPSARFGQGMAYDPALGEVVMFGGIDSSGTYLNDTWLWNGLTWTQESTATSPFAREVPNAMTYDAAQGQVVMFGGFYNQSVTTTFADTWEFGTPQNFGNVNVCPSGQTAPAPCNNTMPLVFNFTASSTTVNSIQVLTQGASNLDFAIAQTAGTNCINTWSAGSSCTVLVTFTPQAPGLRTGAVKLVDAGGNLLTTALIYGVGQGAVAAFSPLSTLVENVGPLTGPKGVLVDAAGDLFVSDYEGHKVVELGPSTNNQVVTIAQSPQVSAPQGLAMDGAGNLYVADTGLPAVVKIPWGCTSSTCQQTVPNPLGLTGQFGVSVDVLGDLFVSAYNQNEVVDVPINGGTQTPVYHGTNPIGTAVDAAGDLFVADAGGAAVVKVPAGCANSSCYVPIGSNWSTPQAVSLDAAGDLYVTDSNLRAVVEIPAGCVINTCQITIASAAETSLGSGFQPWDAVTDGQGNVYIADHGIQRVDAILQQFASVTFSQTSEGSVSGDSPESTLFQNIGNEALTEVSPGLLFTDTQDYSQVPGSGTPADCNSTFSLAPGAACDLSVQFQPESGLLQDNGSAQFTDNAVFNNGQQSIAFSGPVTPGSINYTLTVSALGTGSGAVTDQAEALNCTITNGSATGTCAESYPGGSVVTLTETANSSTFLGWGGACASYGTSSQCQVTMSAAASVTVSYGSSYFGGVNVCPGGNPTGCTGSSQMVTFVFTAPTAVSQILAFTQGATGLDFSAQNSGSCINNFTAGQSCSVNVTFTPTAPGLRLGAVELLSDTGALLATQLIYGIGQGAAAAFTPARQTTVPASNLNYPLGVALDGAGNLYIANYGSAGNPGYVVKITPGGVQSTVLSAYTFAPGVNPAPIGVAVDGAGNLFIADLYLPNAVKLTPNGVQTTVGSGLGGYSTGIALDAMGDVFIADQNNKRVVEVTPAGVQTTVPASGLQQPWGVATDAAGDVFIADGDQTQGITPQVLKITPSGAQSTIPTTGLSRPYHLAVDAAGNVIIDDSLNKRVVEVSPSGVQTTLVTGLNFPSGLTVDAAGDLFIGDQGNQQVYEVNRSQAPSLAFAATNVGFTSTDSPQSVTLQNIGNQHMTGSVSLTSGQNFTIGPSSSCGGFDMFPGESCSENFDFAPQTAGNPLTTTAVFSDNALNGSPATQTVNLSGTAQSSGINYTLTVSPIGSGNGTVTDNTSAISCQGTNGSGSGTCFSSYSSGSTVTLTANAGAGSMFLGWGGACTGLAPTCQVSITGTESVTASFDQQNYGSINVCQPGQTTPAPCSTSIPVTINVPTTATIGAVQVVTQGETGLDFTQASGGTCTGTITAGTACIVNVQFAPLAPGLRMGAVGLYDTTGNLVASTPIYGVGTAPLSAFSPAAQLQVNTGTFTLNYPNGLLTDAAGNLFIADGNNQRVLKIAPNGIVTVVASGLVLPQGMAEDGAGDLFIADNSNQVVEIPAGCASSSCQTAVPNPLGLQSELGVAVDGAGNLFVGDFLDGKVAEVPANGGPQTIVYNPTGCGNAPGCSDPVDLATDAAGDLFIADFGLKTVAEVPAGCTTQSCVKSIGTGWKQPDDVAVDAAGDVFVADQGLGQIVEVPFGCTTSACQIMLVSNISTVAVKVDAVGDVFFDNLTTNPNQVFELARSLPPSLGFALANVGNPSTDSPKSVSVQNVGNQNLSIYGVSATSTTSFSEVPSGSTCGTIPTTTVTVTPGALCNESFSFTPQTPGILVDSAIFSDNTLNLAGGVSVQAVDLNGIGSLNNATGTVVPNVLGLPEAAAATALADAGLKLANVSSAYSSSEPSGTVAGENPAAGSQVNLGTGINLLISTGVAPAPAANPLVLENNYFVTGDFATAGTSLRTQGNAVTKIANGTITIPDSTSNPGIQGIPDGADIVDGFLYWETLENTATPSGGAGTFLGYAISGQQVGVDLPYTDGTLNGTLRVYRADVNNYFQSPAALNGERLGSGAFTITLPDSGASGFPRNEGASLVVIYRVLVPPTVTSGNHPSYPLKSVVIYDGAAIPTTGTTQNVLGFYDAFGTNAEIASLYNSGGNWNGTPGSVPMAAHASTYSLNLNANTAYAAVIFSTQVTNSDNDGILDAWKNGPAAPDFFAGESGYYDVKTQSWVALPGATRGEKDLFVQLDYMCGNVLSNGVCTGENLLPTPDAEGNDPIAAVTQAFKQSGIVLHLEIGNAVPETLCTDAPGQPLCQFPGQPGVIGWKNSLEFSKVWPRNYTSCLEGIDCTARFPYGQKDSYHYVLFGHSLAIPAWNSRFGSLISITTNSPSKGETTITTTSRGAVGGINYCPSRFTLSGILSQPSINGVYNTASCPDGATIILTTPNVTTWSYSNNNPPEPDIGLTSGTVTSISGYSDLGGQDSAVSLGIWEDLSTAAQNMGTRANVIAGTLFHEIGHTIGLSHGGIYYQGPTGSYVPTFDINCKPNYLSSMNYLFQLVGVGPNGAVAYSNQTLQTLTESALGGVVNLVDGSVPPLLATYSTSSWYQSNPIGSESPSAWHCDGTPLNSGEAEEYFVPGGSIAPVTPAWKANQNITYDGQQPGSTGLPGLIGYNDIANVDLRQVGATGGEFASLSSVLAFGNSSAPVNVASGSSLNVGAGGTVTVGKGGSVSLNQGGSLTVGGGAVITGGGTVTFGTGANAILSANASNVTITAGSSGTIVLPVGGNVTLNTGGMITMASGTLTIPASSNPTTVTFAGGATMTVDTGTVTIPAAGGTYTIDSSGGTITLTSKGTVSLSSGTNVTVGGSGTITMGGAGNVTMGGAGNVTINSGGTITMGGAGSFTLTSGGNVTMGGAGSVALANGGTITMGGAGNVTMGGAGTVTMGGAGDLTVGSGASLSLSTNSSVTVGVGGTVTMGGAGTVTMGGAGNVTMGGAGSVIFTQGGTVTMGGAGTVTMGGAGNVTMGGAGTITFTALGGTITMGGAGNVTMGGAGQITLGPLGGTINGLSEPANYSANVSAGTIIGLGASGTVTMGGAGTVTMGGAGNVTMGGAGSITFTQGGTVTMGGAGTVTMGGAGTITMGGAGTITMGGAGSTITMTQGGTITMGGAGNVTMGGAGVVSLGSSGGNVTLGGAGNYSLSSGGGGTVTMGGAGTTTNELDYTTANSVVYPPVAPTYSASGSSYQVNWMAPAFGVVQTYTISRSVLDSNNTVVDPPIVIGSVSGVIVPPATTPNAPATTFTDTNPPTVPPNGKLIYTIATTLVPDTTGSTSRQSAPSSPAVVTVNQTIAMGPLPSSVALQGPTQPTTLTVTATAESNNSPNMQLVNFTTSGPCSVGSSAINTTPGSSYGVSSAIVTLSSTGSCTVTASQAGDSTTATTPPAYSAATPVSGTFMILPQGSTTKSQSITFGPVPNVQYGSNGFSVGATASPSGLPVSFSAAANGPCTVSTATNNAIGTVTGTGLCRITASAPASNNYSAASVTQSFNIAAAPLTVAAVNLSSTYGQPLPSLTPTLNVNYTLGGFVYKESASVVSGAPALTTNATSKSNAGSYTITVSTGTLAAANYSFVYSNGVLQINPATSSTLASNQTATFNSNSQVVALSATVSSAAGTVSGGTVTFTVFNGTTPVGAATTSGTLTNGTASVNYVLPAGTLPATYTIHAVYSSSTNFTGSTDTTHTLTVKYTSSVPSSGTSCNGAYNGTFNGTLTVSKGQNCMFIGGGTNGTITETGGNLVLNGSTVVGGITISGGTFSIGPSTTLKSTLVVQNLPSGSTTNQVCGSTIIGSITFQKNQAPVLFGSGQSCAGNVMKSTVTVLSNATAVTLTGNKITGGVQVQSNSGATTTDSNSIGGGLQIQSNTGAAQVFTNVISGSLQCQSNSSITGSGNTASSKTGQCAKF